MNLDKVVKDLQSPNIKLDTLVQYAQGSNPLVPEYLALSEIKRRQQLNERSNTPAPQTTVAQDLATKAMAPQMPPQGIAGIPPQAPPQALAALPSGMNQQSFAGGGIVAFAGDGPQGSLVKDDRNWFEKWRDSLYSPSETYLSDVMRGKKATAPVGEVPLSAETIEGMRQGKAPPITSADIKRRMPEEKIQGDEQVLFNAERAAKEIKNTTTSKGTVTKTKTDTAAAEAKDPQKKLFEDYEKMLIAQGEDAKAAKQEAKYLRLLEAGLGIMGGTSPHAFANIGAGATSALKGYAQDVAGMRKEERDRIRDLAGIGAKREEYAIDREKLGIMDRRYKEMADIERQKIGAMYAGREDEKFIGQVNRVYQTDMSALKNQLGRELTPDELNNIYRDAYNRVATASGKGSMSGTPAASSNIYDWDQVNKNKAK